MGTRFSSWNLFLLLLFVLFCSNGSRAREMPEKYWIELTDPNQVNEQVDDGPAEGSNVLLLHSMDGHINHDNDDHDNLHVHTHPSSHMDHVNPSSLVFFFLKDLKAGKTMPVYFPNKDPSSYPNLLSKEEANTIPFSSKQLKNLLQLFSFSKDSSQAKTMEDTLRQCESSPVKREIKFCATSLESMLDFARGVFGSESRIQALSTIHLTMSTTLLQNYTVLEVPQKILLTKFVACHTMPYPYAIFGCHTQESTKVFKVLLEGENGDKVDAVAVCHMDTSQWNPNQVAFRLLKTKPGASTVCHFFPADDLVFYTSPV